MNLAPFIETAHILADAAGLLIRDAWVQDATTTFKPDGSPVTPADMQVERRLRDILKARHPDHGVLGEEYGADRRSSALTWVLDPIDGTRQFAARLMNFGVLIALCADGVPVLGVIDQPLAKMRCIAAAGEGAWLNGRRLRSRAGVVLDRAAISLANPAAFDGAARPAFDALAAQGALVVFDGGCVSYMALAMGATDVCLNGFDLDPFDICALVPVVTEAGGRIAAWDRRPLTIDYAGGVVAAGSTALLDETKAVMAEAAPGLVA